jgi:hypothetical protein
MKEIAAEVSKIHDFMKWNAQPTCGLCGESRSLAQGDTYNAARSLTSD